MDLGRIRNFCIIAHIDHGKTTLSDRLLEKTGALSPREMSEQVLDDMPLERERGITIKAHAVRLNYRHPDGSDYQLNLIDTPGHVDFSYEVSRSLAACEGAVLVVDASQGVEAQTLANTYLALEHDLEIIPVINKIDLPGAQPERVREQIVHLLGVDPGSVLLASAKEGVGVDAILETVVERIPPPKGSPDASLKALVFDSWYDPYRGVKILVRMVDGALRPGMRVRFMSNNAAYEVETIGIHTPKPRPVEALAAGEVGAVTAGIKQVADVRIGDTLTDEDRPATVPLPDFKEIKPMVFAGIFPTETHQYEELRDALQKLRLNDASFFYEPETSEALGFGFRCGFLGLLHMEIIQQRLEREFGLGLITTAPGVPYRVTLKSGRILEISNPARMPQPREIHKMEEPYIQAIILTPPDSLGSIFALAEERRGVQRKMEYLSPAKVLLTYDLPLNEVVLDFYDRLKSVSRGYASLDYHFAGWWESPLVKLDILVNGVPVDALSLVIHREKAYPRGRALAQKMKEVVPRQLFEVAIQAAIGSKIIARESVPAMRKNVLAKCYGGDVTRKRKLLEKQKEGKRRMKKVGRVDIPQEAFLALLKI